MTDLKLNNRVGIPLHLLNRHALILGETGTGKSSTILTMTERLADAGVPVFLVDAKGDMGIIRRTAIDVSLLDPYRNLGANVGAMGASLISRALGLSPAQSGAVELAFSFDRFSGPVPLATLDDLHKLIHKVRLDESAGGFITAATHGVIMRQSLQLRDSFVGKATFDVAELLEPSRVSILKGDRIMMQPCAYSALILFLLEQLYSRLPEVGDQPKPRLVFIIDEAHLVFRDLAPAMLQRLEQIVRLIRSKGVALVFASQAATDIPGTIRDQCAHKLAHANRYGVGRPLVETLAPDGRWRSPGIIRVDRPRCQTEPHSEPVDIALRALDGVSEPGALLVPPIRERPSCANVAASGGTIENVLSVAMAILTLWGINTLTIDVSFPTFALAIFGIAMLFLRSLRK